MKSLADLLPPEIAIQIHPDWRKNEAGYWALRDALLEQYCNQWIAFADGDVIASGRNPTDVFHDGQATGRHPFFTCVERENEPTRFRRATFSERRLGRDVLNRIDVLFRGTTGEVVVNP